MANRFFSPNQQFADTTGLPYAGGSLTFYASGTSTPLATYSNRALSIANTNPVVLDSAGRAGDIFLQNLAYKVVLADVNTNPIWTADPVYASDFSTTASFLSGAGSPNGVVAGSAGSATVPASVYWDTINNILYVATTTGNAATTVWTAVNASSAAAIVPTPQGYLTLASGTPIITGDITLTGVFYTPYVGNMVPIYNGSSFVPTVFTELICNFVAAHAALNIYDLFVFNNSGVPTLVTGPSWSAGTAGSITAGSCARGTGAGGAALTRVNGILTNAVQMTGRNGSTTYTINANLGTYVGSIFMDAVNGFVTCHRTYGQSRKWGVWNAYNRVPVTLQVGDGTAAWTYAGTAVRASNNSNNNSGILFAGLAEEICTTDFLQNISSNTAGSQVRTGIGFNNGGAFSSIGTSAYMPTGATSGKITVSSKYIAIPALGINTIFCLESFPVASGVGNFNGTISDMLMTINWRG